MPCKTRVFFQLGLRFTVMWNRGDLQFQFNPELLERQNCYLKEAILCGPKGGTYVGNSRMRAETRMFI
jgi:hypothetical protein